MPRKKKAAPVPKGVPRETDNTYAAANEREARLVLSLLRTAVVRSPNSWGPSGLPQGSEWQDYVEAAMPGMTALFEWIERLEGSDRARKELLEAKEDLSCEVEDLEIKVRELEVEMRELKEDLESERKENETLHKLLVENFPKLSIRK